MIRGLLARSGNVCAFPRCTHPLLNARNQFVAQVAHINAAEPGGPRYNPKQTDADRRAYANLLVLCYRHHVETNDPKLFPARRLRVIKAAHEKAHSGRRTAVPTTVVRKIQAQLQAEVEQWWADVGRASRAEHVAPPDVRLPIDTGASFHTLMRRARRTLNSIDGLVSGLAPSSEDAVAGPNWELHNISLPNLFLALDVLLAQLNVRFLELQVLARPSDRDARRRLEAARRTFHRRSKREVIAD